MFGFLYDIIQLDLTAKSARLFNEVSVDYIPHFFGDRSVVADNNVRIPTHVLNRHFRYKLTGVGMSFDILAGIDSAFCWQHLHFITIGLEFGEGFSGSDVFAHPSTANFLIGEEANL